MVSDTTWGSGGPEELAMVGDACVDGVAAAAAAAAAAGDEADLYTLMRQNGRPLGEYLSAAEQIRARFLLRMPEGEVIRAFVRGFDDLGVQVQVERDMSLGGGSSWDEVRGVVEQVIRRITGGDDGEGEKTANERLAHGVDQTTVNVRKPRRPRRSIPIVPADEEDSEFMAAMMRPH
ncbi:hypothetical protein BO70DRAFT_425395 [Aspergillus heteromorphus CBS 117.55]|uniref:Uncharacterized protein n=1 Tax=Aspergillus heteromorphus CBS 117.55 TaxID=1448321 RepID=A0A317X312_9EURO|nr:uncharacterized protein BO70DRAFT_425395 [Aspergillus heteromorphus CBS 117.55]PWY92725.1 hypothetical protein BO70DRAFT_425395 [Aspergillus heteromorphus CBS 117.55]